MKLRNLFAYREDLVVILRMIVPTYQQHQSINPVAKRDTHLCLHCLTVLAHSLYHIPVRFDSYLREGATRGMLTLVDDAVASLSNKIRMESLSHREAEHILRGELAVVEWRMATKFARLHKKIGVADLFPMKVRLLHRAQCGSGLTVGCNALLAAYRSGSTQNCMFRKTRQ